MPAGGITESYAEGAAAIETTKVKGAASDPAAADVVPS
jgi:hypothetical protein